MAAIHDLLAQIQDEALRNRIEQEVNRLTKIKKFGLVFEQHLPECTPLYDMPIKVGANVMLRNTKEDKSLYVVLKVEDEIAVCARKDNLKQQESFTVKEIVRVAEFGEPIYPYLQYIDSVRNTDESGVWHTLIEADNYHALQLLEYLYAGKVDCIYIDPPYNTGAKDWKYNNDYVDGNDAYRHSKWLSFMERRLRLAKKLLNPKDSVLIITIDEKEYLHLGCLIEELFPEADVQMVDTCINVGGVAKKNHFYRTDEYIFFVQIGDSAPQKVALGEDWLGKVKKTTKNKIRWRGLLRAGSSPLRKDHPLTFYPIFVSEDGKRIVEVGDPIPREANRNSVSPLPGTKIVWPIRSNGEEGRWQIGKERLLDAYKKGYVQLGKFTPRGMAINYLAEGEVKKIENGDIDVLGRNEDGSLIFDTDNYQAKYLPGSQWNITAHDATQYGTGLINSILCEKRFSFPKSLYAVHDALRFYTEGKPDALIVDFFAGSGTTLHAVNLLNAEDGGNRKCILVTNNEVSEEEASILLKKGFKPGDKEWDELGIAKHVTWPRTVCTMEGHDVNGEPLIGEYLGTDISMSDGFNANAVFFKLGFLDKTAVALGLQFKELLPLLWMKSGSIGKCPFISDENLPDMLILPENEFAVLIDENSFAIFAEEVSKYQQIKTIFLITDYEVNYRSMAKSLGVKTTYQLYRDYLDNFRINHGRN